MQFVIRNRLTIVVVVAEAKYYFLCISFMKDIRDNVVLVG